MTLSLARAPHRPPCLYPDPPPHLGPCGSPRLSPRPCVSRLQFILCAFRGNLPEMSILSHPLSQNCKPSWAAPSAPCAPARNEVRCVRNQRLPEPLGARLRCIIVSRLLLLASADWIFQDGDLRFVKHELRGGSAGDSASSAGVALADRGFRGESCSRPAALPLAGHQRICGARGMSRAGAQDGLLGRLRGPRDLVTCAQPGQGSEPRLWPGPLTAHGCPCGPSEMCLRRACVDPCLVPSLACRTVCRTRGPTGAPPFRVTAPGGVPTGGLWPPRDGLLTCLFPPAGVPRAGSLTLGARTSIPTQSRMARASAQRLTETLCCPEGHRTCWLMPWAPEGLSELRLLGAWPCPLLLIQVRVWEGDWSVCGQGQLWPGPARANATGVLGSCSNKTSC